MKIILWRAFLSFGREKGETEFLGGEDERAGPPAKTAPGV